jgi:hypothetical protein
MARGRYLGMVNTSWPGEEPRPHRHSRERTDSPRGTGNPWGTGRRFVRPARQLGAWKKSDVFLYAQ